MLAHVAGGVNRIPAGKKIILMAMDDIFVIKSMGAMMKPK
jgi:hypothetical protein